MPAPHDDEQHRKLMLSIVKGLSDTPMVLKGGTALYLRYGLTRHSEDLDFDSRLPLNLRARVTSAANNSDIIVNRFDTLKDTGVTQRYRVSYSFYLTPDVTHTLKIETKFRDIPNEKDVDVSKGFRVYKLNKLIDQKMTAFENRTKARDLYDVTFLAGRYGSEFSAPQAERLATLSNDKDNILSRFEQAWSSDRVLTNTNIAQLVDRLTGCSRSISQLTRQANKLTHESTINRSFKLGNGL
jgi:predicted nucleotidyltransferase component of viral defense system